MKAAPPRGDELRLPRPGLLVRHPALYRFRLLTAPACMLPDFIIIGSQKGGTSSLYRYLLAHPCVGAASRKEVHFFDLYYRRGLNWYRGHFPSRLYRRWFEATHGCRFVAGEATPDYLFHPEAPERARRCAPGAILVALLRNPVDRAFSHYQMKVRYGRESFSFEQAIDREMRGEPRSRPEGVRGARRSPSAYLARGIYADQLERWLRRFPREQLFVEASERFYADPRSVVKAVLLRLGLPAMKERDYPTYNSGSYAGMPPTIRTRLLEYFAPHNERLTQILGRRLEWDR